MTIYDHPFPPHTTRPSPVEGGTALETRLPAPPAPLCWPTAPKPLEDPLQDGIIHPRMLTASPSFHERDKMGPVIAVFTFDLDTLVWCRPTYWGQSRPGFLGALKEHGSLGWLCAQHNCKGPVWWASWWEAGRRMFHCAPWTCRVQRKDESSEAPGEMLEKHSNAPHAPAVLFTLASLRFFRTYLSNARPSLFDVQLKASEVMGVK